MSSPEFRTAFEPRHGEAVAIADGVQRITANNKSGFTFHGTNSYLLGKKNVGLIDPGPLNDEAHFEAIMRALEGRSLTHIIITHTHMDHSPLARRIQQETGAKTWGEGPHRPARALNIGELNPLDASGDKDFVPDHAIKNGDIIEGDGWALEAIFTPGHAANHMAYALAGTDILFSGDHVMAWATTIVAPPDGSMSDYINSLEVLAARPETSYFPGHGGRLNRAPEFVRALRTHRKMRESAILSRIRAGDKTIPEIVAVIYKETDPRLHGAAGLSVLAHIEDLINQNRVGCDGTPGINSEYYPL